MIGDGKLLTNAHCVEHGTQVSCAQYLCETSLCEPGYILMKLVDVV